MREGSLERGERVRGGREGTESGGVEGDAGWGV